MSFKVIARIGSAEGIEGDLAGIDAQVVRMRLGSEEDILSCADDADAVIQRFLTQMPHHLSVGKGRPQLNAVLVEVDEASGKAKAIQRLQREMAEA